MSKLLVVDDSSTIRRIILRVLRQANLAVDDILEAESGLEALASLRRHPDIDLVLSDVDMPEMNGVDFVRAVRARHSKERLPVIMVTTERGRALAASAIEEGANALVCKPFTPDAIRRVLEPFGV